MSKFDDLIPTYLTEQHVENLNIEAFKSVTNVLFDFIVEGEAQTEDTIAWVCDAVMGSGKTTALKVLLKYMVDSQKRTPLLLVFNELSLMQEIYKDVSEFAESKELTKVIKYVDSDNVNFVLESLNEYQFVCITLQRFRDLALKYGNWSQFKTYNRNPQSSAERLIIVDEMPEFFDTAVFDLSSNNNSVDWFDKLAKSSDLTTEEKQFARTMIMMLFALEMLESEGIRTTNAPLINGIAGAASKKRFEDTMAKLKTDSTDYEASRQLKWFKRLLNEEAVGAIDRYKDGISVLCSERIPYHSMGNILILDGTGHWTRTIYQNLYKIKEVPNYHKYADRLVFHFRDINTSKSARKSAKSNVHNKVASDLKTFRETLRLDFFPLCGKDDIGVYMANKAITDIQRKYFIDNPDDSDTSPINLLNTRGKNVLKDFNGLALLNPPIKHPNHYKLIGIGLYGVNVNLTMSERLKKDEESESSKWFVDEWIQAIYEQSFIADLLQIIHRCSLRKVNETSKIHVVLYTHLRKWLGELLKVTLSLNDKNFTYDLADDKYHFIEKAQNYAQLIKKYCQERSNQFENPTFTAGEIAPKGEIKNWFKSHCKSDFKRQKIKELFSDNGVEIVEETKNGTIWRSFRLTELEWSTRHGL